MLKLQLVVIGGNAEKMPEYYKAQAIDELGERLRAPLAHTRTGRVPQRLWTPSMVFAAR